VLKIYLSVIYKKIAFEKILEDKEALSRQNQEIREEQEQKLFLKERKKILHNILHMRKMTYEVYLILPSFLRADWLKLLH
jgi:hypothetical protein